MPCGASEGSAAGGGLSDLNEWHEYRYDCHWQSLIFIIRCAEHRAPQQERGIYIISKPNKVRLYRIARYIELRSNISTNPSLSTCFNQHRRERIYPFRITRCGFAECINAFPTRVRYTNSSINWDFWQQKAVKNASPNAEAFFEEIARKMLS